MEYVIDKNIRLSNNSWGGGAYSQSLYDVIEASQAVGHIFVAAAGNYARDNDVDPFYPASFDLDNIIAVASTDNDDNKADSSHWGATSVDLGAPGVNIYSTMLASGYGYLSGTSMATPHVSGVAALVTSRYPRLSWQEVRDRVLQRVRPVASLSGITVTGGVVNAVGAISDCNDNGIPDEQDITGGTSEDCAANGIPDECEPDCNDSGQADSCDILDDPSIDCDENGIPDECEAFLDCNENETHDPCDVRDGFSQDVNGNWVPDECETDCNGNGVPDDADITGGTSDDCNDNWVPDDCEPDCNGNEVADECDVTGPTSDDCNRNMIPDECDVGGERWPDDNGNGTPDACEATVLFVDANAGGYESGLSWANAFTDLQDAFAIAQSAGTAVEQVWVADGTYTPDRGTGDRTAVFELANGVAVYGGFAGGETDLSQRDPTTHATILSGDLLGDDGPDWANREDNSCTIVHAYSVDETAVLDGFTITAGYASGAYGKLIERYGGGMYIEHISTPTIVNCNINGNSADFGGGITVVLSMPSFVNCTISDNFAFARGGGMTNFFYSEPVLTNCIFTGNSAYSGGGMYNWGGISGTLKGCTFNGNTAEVQGGGVYDLESTSTFVNCKFNGNSVVTHGGGVYNHTSSTTLINCMFTGNSALNGGAINSYGGDTSLSNCTLSGNVSTSYAGPGGLRTADNNTTITNSILWGNSNGAGMEETAQLAPDGGGILVVDYTCVQGWTGGLGGLGNHGDDPMFVDPDGDDDIVGTEDDDPRLSPGSACIDAGDNASVPADTFDLDDDGDTDEPTPFDLAEYPRFVDDPGTPDGGAGVPPIVDMGSYEFIVDCNENRVPDHLDILGGGSRDCNENGTPDECDIGSGASEDCQPNDVPDECDIESMASADCQPNNIPDECDVAAGTSADCNSNDLPDECEPDEDCNTNGVQDICDIAAGTCEDCNNNNVPDECEPDDDCNTNGVQDICDIAAGTSEDCQPNGVPDECDMSGGTSPDLNANGTPDECDAVMPLPENSLGITDCTDDDDCSDEARCVLGICYAPKHRYISIARNPEQVPDTARRVRLGAGDPIGWVGEPDYVPPTSQHDGLWLADIVSFENRHYAEQWPDIMHVKGCEIAHASLCDASGDHCNPNPCPGGETCVHHAYHVQAIVFGQNVAEEGNYSDPLVLHTPSTWGDTVSSCPGNVCKPPDGVVGLDDIMAAIKKYQIVDLAPITWLDIDPSDGVSVPEQIIGVGDIMNCIDGYQGKPYPGLGPLSCP